MKPWIRYVGICALTAVCFLDSKSPWVFLLLLWLPVEPPIKIEIKRGRHG